jgi:tryptophan synthase alpha subunit
MRQTTAQVLEARKASGKGSLIGYFPAGYPTLDESVEVKTESMFWNLAFHIPIR